MTNRLKQYKDRLNPSQVADGINAANKNAERLYLDAKLLFENSRYPSSIALSILSVEESGKASILRGLSLSVSGKELKGNWKRYRNHRAKNTHWIALDLMLGGAKNLEGISQVEDPDSEHPEILEQLKQVAFYTDCLGSAHWSIPEDVVDKELCEKILKVAEIFSKRKECSEQQVDLWIKHMLPVKDQPQKIQNQALHNWFREMEEKGFMTEGKVSYSSFLGIDDKH